MDNLTHTVIGLVAGEAIARTVRSPRRTSLLVAAMVGSNLPDSDLLVSYGDGKLGYLLQHRGYTHTIVGCVLLTLLLYAAIAMVWRWQRIPATRRDHGQVLATSLLCVALHLGMDALNNYGVHPFWPFDDRWYYGDALFIVEPLYWIAAAPLVLLQRSIAARGALGLAVLVALAVNGVVHPGQPLWWIGLTLATLALVMLGRESRAMTAALVSAASCLAITLVFVQSSRVVAEQVEASAASRFPEGRFLDHALTPGPMQPGCWDVLLMQQAGDRYVALKGRAVTTGDVESARCSRLHVGTEGTAPWQSLSARPEGTPSRVRWEDGLEFSVRELASHVRGDCRAEALMQFVRAPFLAQWQGHGIVGDLRFDRESGPGFAEIELAGGEGRCPRAVPWTPPRAALLGR